MDIFGCSVTTIVEVSVSPCSDVASPLTVKCLRKGLPQSVSPEVEGIRFHAKLFRSRRARYVRRYEVDILASDCTDTKGFYAEAPVQEAERTLGNPIKPCPWSGPLDWPRLFV